MSSVYLALSHACPCARLRTAASRPYVAERRYPHPLPMTDQDRAGGDRRRLRVVNRSALDCGRLWRCERSLASSGRTAVGTHKRIDEESLRV
jgi:hypothetical protein